MKKLDYSKIKISGDLLRRATLNMDRLERDYYTDTEVFQKSSYEWPGDWEGRTILALISCEESLNRKAKYLKSIMDKLPNYLNSDLYFGDIFDGKTISEQLVSGNSWFARSMCEHYKKYKDEFSLKVIDSLVKKLFIPLTQFYKNYPLIKKGQLGEAMGQLVGEVINGWKLSSDTACAFIPIDGMTACYEITKDEKLKTLIEIVIEKFSELDVVNANCQTHATLSATRGIIRFYEETKESKYLTFAKELFEKYLSFGLTINDANYNWFNRPEWTEGCAVFDSAIVAMRLFMYTNDFKYLKFANSVYYNAIKFSQRSNGGIGCDSCLTENQPILKSSSNYEAYWCCTMRGAEGFFEYSQFLCLYDSLNVYLPFLNDCQLHLNDFILNEKVDYGKEIKIQITLSKQTNKKIYVPIMNYDGQIFVNKKATEIENGYIVLDGNECSYQIVYKPSLRQINIGDKKMYFYGFNVLGSNVSEGNEVFEIDNKKLTFIQDMTKLPEEVAKKIEQKVIFDN